MKLFGLVKKTGALNTAARELGMSYSHAWNTVYKINCQLNHPLVVTRRGGKGGGIAYLTPEGEELLKSFTALQKEIRRLIKSTGINDKKTSLSA
ncbi:winged helix-turn-helix domain-containing protein [Marinilabilia rubra]|nr:LysR family transcriptional regulator [Marinilabilia rubra]